MYVYLCNQLPVSLRYFVRVVEVKPVICKTGRPKRKCHLYQAVGEQSFYNV